MRLFVDTSAFYALIDADDINHEDAGRAWPRILVPENTLLSSNYVLVESFALIQNRLGIPAVRTFQEDILPVVSVEFVDPAVHRSGLASLLSSARRGLSLVDCVSFEIMRTLGIKEAFAFDPHFKEQGFILVA
jgi:uncharacterized protein